ncbi:hypothetical protein AG1IA_08908 [Rhizoctonia solani AG-1 IA]|uniref:Uncharacterized protein n=1 Tax=Thanatephorus cucumeris (strain AG1-IA) TaxID=983506 RepID=L8WJS2_THACA|nr:hypothetical protein AG1IA_08908 [Rhizoctonia solani AG-1 IA]
MSIPTTMSSSVPLFHMLERQVLPGSFDSDICPSAPFSIPDQTLQFSSILLHILFDEIRNRLHIRPRASSGERGLLTWHSRIEPLSFCHAVDLLRYRENSHTSRQHLKTLPLASRIAPTPSSETVQSAILPSLFLPEISESVGWSPETAKVHRFMGQARGGFNLMRFACLVQPGFWVVELIAALASVRRSLGRRRSRVRLGDLG